MNFHSLSEVTGECHATFNNYLPVVMSSQSIQGQWVYFASSWNSPSLSVYHCFKAFSDSASCLSTADANARLLWNTSASFNWIYLGVKYNDCLAEYTFTDVRVYVNSALDTAQQEAVFTQMSAYCTSDCSVCSSPVVCQTCADGFVALSGECAACSGTCKTCSGTLQTQCTSCVSGTYKSPPTNQCVDSCGDGFYPDVLTSTCMVCPAKCATCSDASTCVTCATGYLPISNPGFDCVASCPSTHFSDSIQCQLSPSKCLTCSGSSQCTSCPANFKPISNPTLDCLSECPDGFYYDQVSKSCLTCDFKCKTCMTRSVCLSCIDTLYTLHATVLQCLGECPNGYYYEGTTCKPCNAQCSGCTGPSNSECEHCAGGFYKIRDAFLSAKKTSTSRTHSANNATVHVPHATPLLV
jgi:hypothetical protein